MDSKFQANDQLEAMTAVECKNMILHGGWLFRFFDSEAVESWEFPMSFSFCAPAVAYYMKITWVIFSSGYQNSYLYGDVILRAFSRA